MNIQQLKEFVCLEKRKKDLDAELKAVKQQLDDLEEALVNADGQRGLQQDDRRRAHVSARSGRVRQPAQGPRGRR